MDGEMSLTSLSYSMEKNTLQQDHESAVASLVSGSYRMAHDVLRFATGMDTVLVTPQPWISSRELGMGDGRVNLSEFSSRYPLDLKVMKYAR